MTTFCYWTIGDGEHAALAKSLVMSARNAGITDPFHVWTDEPAILGAEAHNCGNFSHDHYLFKFHFLRDHVQKLDYDFYVFLDADCYFVRKPPPWEQLLRDNKWFAQMENDATSPFINRTDWWGCPIRFYPQTLRYRGVKSERIYNTNAGLFVVRRDAVEEFCKKALDFFHYCRNELRLVNFTEEAALAYVGHFVDNPDLNTLAATCKWWATEWTGEFFNDTNKKLPDGRGWRFEDYLTGEKRPVNPAIVHCLRAKETLKGTVK